MYRIMTIALLLGLSGAVAAKPEKAAVQMDRQGSVAEQMRQVETALAAPDYAELSAEDRGQVQQSLSRIRQHLGERQTVQELPPQRRGSSVRVSPRSSLVHPRSLSSALG